MKESNNVKELIINVTTELINQSNGNINGITTRLIADKARVSVGLINYHFQTKENLIEICVQRIIGNLFVKYNLQTENNDCIDLLKQIVKTVFDYFLKFPAISKISILGDLQNPNILDNTSKGMSGFLNAMANCGLNEKDKLFISFSLISTIQISLLRKNVIKDTFGYNLENKDERDYFIDLTIEGLMSGKYEKKE